MIRLFKYPAVIPADPDTFIKSMNYNADKDQNRVEAGSSYLQVAGDAMYSWY